MDTRPAPGGALVSEWPLGADTPPLRVTPIVRELPGWLTPLRALGAVERAPHTVFLESGGDPAGGTEREWTLLAFDPVHRFELRADRDAFADLAAIWPDRVELTLDVPGPFASGL